MKEFKIYLAGAMSDISYEESNVWRDFAKEYLETRESDYSVKAINPNNYYNFKNITHETEKEIIRFDLHKVRTSDLILVNLNGKSIGTAMELEHAYDKGIPIIGYKDDNEVLHPWLEFVSDRVFKTLADSIIYINDYYLS